MPGNPVRRKPEVDLSAIPGHLTPEESRAQARAQKAAMEAYLGGMPKGDILDAIRTPFNVMGNSMVGLGAEMLGKGDKFEKYAYTPKTQAEMKALEAMMAVMGPGMDLMDYLKIPPIGPGLPTLASAMHGVDTAATRLATQQAARAAANAGKGAKKAVKDLATSDAAYNLANKVAMASGAAPKQIIMGPTSKTWNHGNAALAKHMELQGENPEAIWKATGTFRGPDDLWRQEIPDVNMKYSVSPVRSRQYETDRKRYSQAIDKATTQEELQAAQKYYEKQRGKNSLNFIGKAQEFIEHPELFQAYPELANYAFRELEPTHKKFTAPQNVYGFYSPGQQTITVNTDAPLRRSTALHELQHAIQEIEGWQGGSSPQEMAARLADREIAKTREWDLLQSIQEMQKTLPPSANNLILTEGQKLKNIQDFLKQTRRLEGERDPYNAYRRVSGEEEARMVQARQPYSEEKLAERPPFEDYETDPSYHITNFAGGGEVHMNKGGILGRVAKTAEKGLERATKGMQQVLPAAERAANLEAFLSKSQVREPLYHATPKDIKAFKPGGDDPTMSGRAIWTTTSKTNQPAQHNIGSRKAEFREGVNVMPLHGRAERPLMLDDPGMVDWAQEVFAGGSREFPELLPDQWLKEVKDAGYDSVILADPHGRGDPHEVIFFEPTQLKSALGNRGTYDINDPDLNKADGGTVTIDVFLKRMKER